MDIVTYVFYFFGLALSVVLFPPCWLIALSRSPWKGAFWGAAIGVIVVSQAPIEMDFICAGAVGGAILGLIGSRVSRAKKIKRGESIKNMPKKEVAGLGIFALALVFAGFILQGYQPRHHSPSVQAQKEPKLSDQERLQRYIKLKTWEPGESYTYPQASAPQPAAPDTGQEPPLPQVPHHQPQKEKGPSLKERIKGYLDTVLNLLG